MPRLADSTTDERTARTLRDMAIDYEGKARELKQMASAREAVTDSMRLIRELPHVKPSKLPPPKK